MSVTALPLSVEEQPLAAAPSTDRRGLAAATEVAIVAAFYQWYSVVRYWVAGSTSSAQRNAMHVVAWEREIGRAHV